MHAALSIGLALLLATPVTLAASATITVPRPPGHRGSEIFPASGDTLSVTFPVEFDVLPHNRLYVRGERLTRVQLTTAPGDTLFLNGVPVMPFGRCPEVPVVFTEEMYLRLYGDVPYVQRLMNSRGMSASAAFECFVVAMDSLRLVTARVYQEARDRGATRSEATAAAIEEMPALDKHGLVNWQAPIVAGSGSVRLRWNGQSGQRAFGFAGYSTSQDTTGVDTDRRSAAAMPSEREKAGYAVRLYDAMTYAPEPLWRVITCGGWSQWGGFERAERAERVLEAARSFAEYEEGVLSRLAVTEIVGREQEEAARQQRGNPEGEVTEQGVPPN